MAVASAPPNEQRADTCVTTSLGTRWAITGPLMANALGGGGGPDGFRHILTHIGATSKVWSDDMKAHEFDHSAEAIDRVNASVQLLLERHPAEKVMRVRDGLTIELLKLKAAKA